MVIVTAGRESALFMPGDVIRSHDGEMIGVVLNVITTLPAVELYVDAARNGAPEGIGVWDPEDAIVANDDESRTEARRLGLRFPGGNKP